MIIVNRSGVKLAVNISADGQKYELPQYNIWVGRDLINCVDKKILVSLLKKEGMSEAEVDLLLRLHKHKEDKY